MRIQYSHTFTECNSTVKQGLVCAKWLKVPNKILQALCTIVDGKTAEAHVAT